jgi:hypothetical protein
VARASRAKRASICGCAGELGADDRLDRDLLAQLQVLGDVDRAHAALAEPLDDAVAVVDPGGGEARAACRRSPRPI